MGYLIALILLVAVIGYLLSDWRVVVLLVVGGGVLLWKKLTKPSSDFLVGDVEEMPTEERCIEYLAMAETVFLPHDDYYNLDEYIKYLRHNGSLSDAACAYLTNYVGEAGRRAEENSSGWGKYKDVNLIKEFNLNELDWKRNHSSVNPVWFFVDMAAKRIE